ncbi:MAG: helix-turn-helix domain-containing protein [Solirubrobacterales bacterium]
MSSSAREENAFFGQAVRSLREDAGLTQEQVADASESRLSASWISNMENGKVNPRRRTMKRIAKGIGVSLSQIESLAEAYEEISKRKVERERGR